MKIVNCIDESLVKEVAPEVLRSRQIELVSGLKVQIFAYKGSDTEGCCS